MAFLVSILTLHLFSRRKRVWLGVFQKTDWHVDRFIAQNTRGRRENKRTAIRNENKSRTQDCLAFDFNKTPLPQHTPLSREGSQYGNIPLIRFPSKGEMAVTNFPRVHDEVQYIRRTSAGAGPLIGVSAVYRGAPQRQTSDKSFCVLLTV